MTYKIEDLSLKTRDELINLFLGLQEDYLDLKSEVEHIRNGI